MIQAEAAGPASGDSWHMRWLTARAGISPTGGVPGRLGQRGAGRKTRKNPPRRAGSSLGPGWGSRY